MELPKQTIGELKNIVMNDYGIDVADQEINEFGCSLLRLARMANVALARADERRGSSAEARGIISSSTAGLVGEVNNHRWMPS